MFTGIVEEVGRVRAFTGAAPSARLEVSACVVVDDAALGSSIAVNGACLTVVELDREGFVADVVAETLARTNLGRLQPGDPVNLERPLRVDGRFGGHIVQGHVDATAEVLAVVPDEDGGAVLELALPDALRPFVLEKGSVALDGVSLTVAAVGEGRLRIALIPHTLAVTTFGARRPGDVVNVEADYVAKVVANLGSTAIAAGGAR
jgi:riboflavin synthase